MDRREAIKALAGTAALGAFVDVLKAEGIEVSTVSQKTSENSVLLVFRNPGVVSQVGVEQLTRSVERLFTDAALEHVRVSGVHVEILVDGEGPFAMNPAKRTKWRIVDQMIEEHGDGET